MIRLPGVHLLHQDPRTLVAVKPAGLSSEQSAADGPSLLSLVRAALPSADPALPHRLDRVTRGVVVVALDRQAAAAHNEHVRAGHWAKFYLARVPAGRPLLGEHRAYLRREGRAARIVRSGGDPSRLEVLAEGDAPGRPCERHLLIRLHTGRYHQVRVMCAGLGFPLVGDPLYGGLPGPFHLEHALLWYRSIETDAPALAWWAEDPEREPLHPQVAAALRSRALQPPEA